ncbi:Ubiquitin--protein ligase [Bertholletia excelsa]
MENDVLITPRAVLPSEILSQTMLAIVETVNASKLALIEKENFNKFSNYLERIIYFLRELSMSDIQNSDRLRDAVDILNGEIRVAKKLALLCSNRSKLYLLLNCQKIVKNLEDSTKKFSRALSLISLASLDAPLVLGNEISKLCKNMLDAEFRITELEEEIMDKIKTGIEARNIGRSYANDLLIHITKAAGISDEQSELKSEFEALKGETENDELRGDIAEALWMEQIIALLSKADIITTPEEKEKKYLNKRNSLGRQLLEPLQSFYCPITGDIMVDPVETPTGHIFERDAIEKWLTAGNSSCPLTMMPLNRSLLRSNKTLRESIEEWKNRNTMIMIASLKPKVQSDEEQEVLHALGKLLNICVERELHQECIILEGYIPILVGLLGGKSSGIRKHALDILCILAKDKDDNKDRIVGIDNAIEFVVHCLAHKVQESKSALRLLLELSRNNVARNLMGSVQGCILLLIAMSNSDDSQAASDAHELIDNLGFDNQNVIQMAKANYFGPLLRILSTGTQDGKVMMARTLAEVELTEYSKLSLFKDGAQGPLLQLLSHGDIETKKVAVRALQNLSSIPQNGLQMIREGAVGPLFELLYHHNLSSPSLRKRAAATIMQLALSNTAPEADHMQLSIFKSDEEIFKFFSLISLTGPDTQQIILQTFIAICQSSSGLEVRNTLRQISATRLLAQLCELDYCPVRTNAMKLFCWLTEDGTDSSLLDHVGQRCIETLLRIARTSENVEEIASAMGIISNLPKNSQVTQWLLDAGTLQVIFVHLSSGDGRKVTENAAGALCHFTDPTNPGCQKKVAEVGFIPILVDLLVSGTSLTKQNVATSLKQLSENSAGFSRPVKKQAVFRCCLASTEMGCPIHLGICSLNSSFCLVEADAIRPLARVLAEQHLGACEAALDALLTLIEGDLLYRGSKVLDEANAIPDIIKLLSSNVTKLQEKALRALERIFQLVDYKEKYGTSAQLPLVDITQRGTSGMKSLAAKTLAHLNLIHDQSSYF